MNDELLKRLDTFAGKLAEMGQQLGPQVWDLTLTAMRVQALHGIMQGLSGIVAMYVCYRIALKLYPPVRKAWTNFDNEAVGFGGGFALAVATIVGMVGLVVASSNLLSAWLWIGLYDPRLLLAKKVLGL